MKLRADRREERRLMAAVRNTAWRELTPAQQTISLAKRRGASKRQMLKLGKVFASQAEARRVTAAVATLKTLGGVKVKVK